MKVCRWPRLLYFENLIGQQVTTGETGSMETGNFTLRSTQNVTDRFNSVEESLRFADSQSVYSTDTNHTFSPPRRADPSPSLPVFHKPLNSRKVYDKTYTWESLNFDEIAKEKRRRRRNHRIAGCICIFVILAAIIAVLVLFFTESFIFASAEDEDEG